MTLWDLIDRHMVAANIYGYVSMGVLVVCFVARTIWRTEDAVQAVGDRLFGMAKSDRGNKS